MNHALRHNSTSMIRAIAYNAARTGDVRLSYVATAQNDAIFGGKSFESNHPRLNRWGSNENSQTPGNTKYLATSDNNNIRVT